MRKTFFLHFLKAKKNSAGKILIFRWAYAFEKFENLQAHYTIFRELTIILKEYIIMQSFFGHHKKGKSVSWKIGRRVEKKIYTPAELLAFFKL